MDIYRSYTVEDFEDRKRHLENEMQDRNTPEHRKLIIPMCIADCDKDIEFLKKGGKIDLLSLIRRYSQNMVEYKKSEDAYLFFQRPRLNGIPAPEKKGEP